MMKKITFYLSILLLLVPLCTLHSQNDTQALAGSWIGSLKAGAISLRIIFNLTPAGQDSLTVTMDSPDQGVKNLKIGPATLANGNLRILALMMMGEYNGTLKNDTLINGTWKQAGQTFPLDLTKLREKFTLNRPQEPKRPLPYTEQEVTFHNQQANIDLAGTLTIPEGAGPFKAAVLITGSGAQNRDEELLGHKPFLVLADRLTRNGIAVLRFDDRGVGKSKGSSINATSADFATDVASAIDFLKKNPKIYPDKIGLIGHSEGGIIAPLVASKKNIAFIVSLAGTGVPGDEIIFRQSADISRASGLSENAIADAVEINKKLFPILKDEKDNMKASEKMVSEYRKMLEGANTSEPEMEKSIQQLKASLNPGSLTWLRYFISTDPALSWKKVKCPVLALNGDKDLQVAADVNLPAIEKALKAGGNKSVKTMKLPGLNHLFQHSETGLPAEYGNIEETFSEDALSIIYKWINSL
ncbi:MAG TPA: alpha/beta fold hydrolase [Bacteroidales bacterium]|nr:alpha/beta fold hydrolase [Bacteroidales bacterium]